MLKGGPGSGHRGHRGIPGQRGGSLPGAGKVTAVSFSVGQRVKIMESIGSGRGYATENTHPPIYDVSNISKKRVEVSWEDPYGDLHTKWVNPKRLLDESEHIPDRWWVPGSEYYWKDR